MNMKKIVNSKLMKELLELKENGLLYDHITIKHILDLLSPQAKYEWNKLLAFFEPSPIARIAGFTNVDVLCYMLQKALITKDAKTEEEADERMKLHMKVALLGQGRDIDRYDLTPRKVRCISRGYRYDRQEEWEKTLMTLDAIEEKLKSDHKPVPKSFREEILGNLMEEPEAEQLIIGKIYTMTGVLPDIPLSDGRESHTGLLFLEEIHSKPKKFFDYPDGGFHNRLFEELEEVSVADRIRHHDEYFSMNEE